MFYSYFSVAETTSEGDDLDKKNNRIPEKG